VNKTAASAAQLAKCILLHASARTTAVLPPSCARTYKYLIADLTVGKTVFLVKN